jgi:copper transport protein
MTPRRLALAALGGILVALGLGTPASAHATLTGTDPASGALLPNAPAVVTLTFSEGVRAVADRIRVVGPDRTRVDNGPAQVTGTRLAIPLRRDAGQGTYLVTYRVISSDSHPIAGSFTYSVGAPSADPPTSVDGDARRADPVVAVALGTARYLSYAGLALVVGPMLFLAGLWPRRLSRRGPGRIVAVGVTVLGVATAAEMFLQGPYTAGSSLFGASAEALNEALAGSFGTTHAVRLGVLAAIAVLLRGFLRPSGPSTVDMAVVSFLGVVGIGTWPLSGHPVASPLPTVSLIADAAHLGSMAIWLGGLVVLVTLLLPRANARELTAILPVWSSWAMLAVVILAVTGTAQALIEVDSVSALFGTGYGRLVLAKVALLGLVVAVAWFSRQFVARFVGGGATAVPEEAPALAHAGAAGVAGAASERVAADGSAGGGGGAGGDGAGGDRDGFRDDDDGPGVDDGPGGKAGPATGPLRRSVLAELAVTGVVLALAATLVQTPPARTAAAEVDQPNIVNLSSDLYLLRSELNPGQVGPNTLHLYAFNKAGAPQKVVEWKITAAPVDGSIEALDVPTLPVTEDHAVAQPSFPTPGEWELRYTIRLSDVDQSTVSHRVTIRE